MTDRHAGYIVVLERDIREDDAEHVINALRMTKGVLIVEPIVTDTELHIAESRALAAWREKLHDVLYGQP
jgi:hypothetical protein